MLPGETATTPAPRRRLKKRILIPLALLVILSSLFAALWIRGTVAETTERNPTSPADGVVTQLLLAADGRKVVRCAVVVEDPVERVWKAVTDYAQFEKTFPTIQGVQSSVEADGRHRLVCEVSSILGSWPIDVRIRHEETPARYVASWDEPSGDVVVNRGSWTLLPAPGGMTLVVYTLDVEVRPFPGFLVRAVLLSRQKTVLTALKDHLRAERR